MADGFGFGGAIDDGGAGGGMGVFQVAEEVGENGRAAGMDSLEGRKSIGLVEFQEKPWRCGTTGDVVSEAFLKDFGGIIG